MSAVASVRPYRSKGAVMLRRMGTQEEVARLIGCSQQYVSDWELGERVPAPHWRMQIEAIFGIAFGLWDIPVSSNLSPEPSVRATILRELAPWPEAKRRAEAILRRMGIP